MRKLDLSREHPDPYAEALPALLVDRQRVVYSAAFRRLQHKTQAFVAPESDHYRSRLTHTLEVAHQARCIALTLGLDADLAEVVGLAHDLGHPPFGHAGEKALDECLRDHGGFEHNRHTLRVVEQLEHPYPEFLGLNLTRVVRECLAKHSTRYDRPGSHPLQDGQAPPAECHVVDLADRLAYALHDLQDGLYAGSIDPGDLQTLELWRQAYDGPPADVAAGWRGHLRPAVDRIQAAILADLKSIAAGSAEPRVRLSERVERQLQELDRFLYTHVYRSEALRHADEQAGQILSAVFRAYAEDPELLPPRFHKRIAEQGLQRVITDYVAGMTDRFCIDEHTRLAETAQSPKPKTQRSED